VLENQDARPLWVVRVILHHNGGVQTIDDITDIYTVCRKLLVPVQGYTHVAARHEGADLFKGPAQCREPSVSGIRCVPL